MENIHILKFKNPVLAIDLRELVAWQVDKDYLKLWFKGSNWPIIHWINSEAMTEEKVKEVFNEISQAKDESMRGLRDLPKGGLTDEDIKHLFNEDP